MYCGLSPEFVNRLTNGEEICKRNLDSRTKRILSVVSSGIATIRGIRALPRDAYLRQLIAVNVTVVSRI